jgi:predicted MFS family arabinose efflux permease
VGIGTGCFIQAGYAVIQAVVPPAEMAYGISYMMLGRSPQAGNEMSLAALTYKQDN